MAIGGDVSIRPLASVLIRTFNEERDLPALLEAIAGQSLVDHEVVVVDSGSQDRTREIAEAAGARIVRIDSRDFTFGYSLNVGVRQSRADVVVIVSAHTVPIGEHWLANLVESFADPSVAMAYGRQLGNEESKFAERQDFLRTFPGKSEVLEPPHFFANNANAAIRRRDWEDHPFDEALTGLEDIEWARHWLRRGRKVTYRADAAIYHIHRESWRQVRHRYYREALAMRAMGLAGTSGVSAALAELQYLATDLIAFPKERVSTDRLVDVIRFRYEKARGTIRGLGEGQSAPTPRTREELFFDRRYSAVVVTGPGRARLEERTIPTVRPGEILVEVAYVGVCGTDLEVRDGALAYFQDGRAGFPIVPGHEVSGRVASLGVNVTNVAEGDRVVIEPIQGCGTCSACAADDAIACTKRKEMGVFGMDGGYGPFLLTRSEYAQVVPDELDLLRACLCEPTAVVLKGLRRSEPWSRSSREALIVGGGTIGFLAAILLRARGIEVTIAEKQATRRAHAVESRIAVSESLEGYRGQGFVVEATGNATVLAELLERVRPGTCVLALGLPYGRQPFSFESIVSADLTVVGSVGSGSRDFRAALEALASLSVQGLLKNTVPLKEYHRAWELTRAGSVPKVILEVMPEHGRATRSPTMEVAGESGGCG